MQLHPECRARLVERLAQALPSIHVKNGRYLAFDTLYQLASLTEILPANLRASAESWLGGEPILMFVEHSLHAELESRPYSPQPDPTPLTQLPGYENAQLIADRIVEQFATLPWTYSVFTDWSLYLRDFNRDATAGDGVALSDTISLVRGDAIQHPPPDPPPQKVYLLAFPPKAEWNANTIYLRVQVQGQIRPFSSPTTDAYETVVRAVAGIGLSIGLFVQTTGLWGSREKLSFYAYREQQQANPGPTKSISIEFPHDHAQTLARMGWNPKFEQIPVADARMALTIFLAQMRAAFTSNEPTVARIRTAARWYFDSICTSSELVAFVQATVCLETLLGDKAVSDVMGLGELLRNRCAYLLGRTSQQREQIMERFKSIYSTRSQIVHRGKDRLLPDEQADLHYLRQLCRDVINRELELHTPEPLERTPIWVTLCSGKWVTVAGDGRLHAPA